MGQNKKNKRPNYFDQNIQKFGPDFLEYMPLDMMKKDSDRIFRELAKGNIDIDKYGNYFTNPRFLETLISSAEIKHNFYSISRDGVHDLLVKNVQGLGIIDVYEYHAKAAKGYEIIVTKLTEFRYYQDPIILKDMIMNLVKFRYNI